MVRTEYLYTNAQPCPENALVVTEASSLIEALTKISNEVFDLVLVGDQSALEPHDFLKSAREAAPATCFAIISACDTRTAILASLAAGFHGFISKQQSDSEILAAISDILAGRIYVPSSVAGDSDTLGDRFGKEALPKLSTEADVIKLTKRQREVLSLLVRGLSNKEIARVLAIAEATTKIHMAALVRAFGVRNSTEAAYKARNFVALTELSAAPLIAGNDGQTASALALTGVGSTWRIDEQVLPYVERRIAVTRLCASGDSVLNSPISFLASPKEMRRFRASN